MTQLLRHLLNKFKNKIIQIRLWLSLVFYFGCCPCNLIFVSHLLRHCTKVFMSALNLVMIRLGDSRLIDAILWYLCIREYIMGLNHNKLDT